MKSNINTFFTLTNKYFYWFIFISIIFILTLINNYYFYSHVQRSSEVDAKQLKVILEGNIEYCKMNDIQISKCQELIKQTIYSFSDKAHYNNSIKIDNVEISKNKKYDNITGSNISINLPNENLNEFEYHFTTNMSYIGVIISVIKSMTFSISDIVLISYEQGIKTGFEKFEISFWYRSRPVIVFSLITYLILWVSRKRSYQLKNLQLLEEEKMHKDFEEKVKLQSKEVKNELINQVKSKIDTYKNIISPPFSFNNIELVFENELDTIGTRFRKVAEKIIFDIYEKKIGPIPYKLDLGSAVHELNKNKIISDNSRNYLSIVRIYGNISAHYSKNNEITKEEAISIASALMIVIEELYEKGLLQLQSR